MKTLTAIFLLIAISAQAKTFSEICQDGKVLLNSASITARVENVQPTEDAKTCHVFFASDSVESYLNYSSMFVPTCKVPLGTVLKLGALTSCDLKPGQRVLGALAKSMQGPLRFELFRY